MADPNPHLEQPTGVPQFDAAPRPLTIRYASGDMVVAYFSESDIDAIASAGASLLYLTFFGICLGVFATLGAIFLGSDVTEPKKLAICIALIFTSGIGTVVFGFLGRSEYKNSRATAARFKEKFSQTKKEGHS